MKVLNISQDATPMANPIAHLAPQDHYRPSKTPLKGATELTKTDRNRLRRRMKASRKVEGRIKREQEETAARFDGRKRGRLERKDALRQLDKRENVTILAGVDKRKGKGGVVGGKNKKK